MNNWMVAGLNFSAVFILLAGCGSKSGGNDSASSAENASLVCEADKICIGSSKEDVVKLLGNPSSISNQAETKYATWDFDETDKTRSICGSASPLCYVVFDFDGNLKSHYNISTKFIEPSK
jgi:outer membrane protein assembly factor BamE (lipoprotein component of BamABCDE complex)